MDILRGLIMGLFVLGLTGCETMNDFLSTVPAVSFTDEKGNTVGRVCKDLEGGGKECSNLNPDGLSTKTIYDKDGKIVSVEIIEKPAR